MIPKGQAYINEIDIAEYGALLVRGWREALLKPASMKSYISNSSRLEHGERYLASSSVAKYSKRDVSLTFMITGDSATEYLSNYDKFLVAIMNGEFLLRVPILNNSVFHLVYTSCESFGDYGLKCGKFVVKLTEPDPTNRKE